jgi:hypothetical protein
VVGKTSTVWDAIVLPDGTTEVTVEVDPVGQIDSKLRFTPPEPRYYKNARHFKLVFSDRRWEVGAKGDATKEVTESSRRWLIDEPNDTLMLSITPSCAGTVYGSTAAGSEREERDLGAKFWRRDGSRKCKDAVAGRVREVGRVLVRRVGIEPTTYGLRVHCSTN